MYPPIPAADSAAAAPVAFNTSGPPDPSVSLWTFQDVLTLAGVPGAAVPDDGLLAAASFFFECDFDSGVACLPRVVFSRIDDPTSSSQGFNYRRVVYNPDGSRDLFKWWGLRLLLEASGVGHKFTSIVPALQAFGAGIALVTCATVVADFLIEYVLPHRKRYVKKKIEEIEDASEQTEDDDEAVSDDHPVTESEALIAVVS